MTTVHTYPVSDLIEHDTDGGDCVCGPTTIPVPRDDGSVGWVVVHHSLDGREGNGMTTTEAARAAARQHLAQVLAGRGRNEETT